MMTDDDDDTRCKTCGHDLLAHDYEGRRVCNQTSDCDCTRIVDRCVSCGSDFPGYEASKERLCMMCDYINPAREKVVS